MFIDTDGTGNQDDQNLEPGTSAESEAEATTDQGPGDGGKAGATAPTLESLQAQLQATQQQLQAASMRLLDPDYIEYRQSGGRRKAEPKAEPIDPLAGLTDDKLSAMTNRELIETAVSAFATKLESEILPKIEERLQNIGESVQEQRASADVQEVAAKHPDFWDHKREMVALSSQPKFAGLGAEELYILAKGLSGKGGPTTAPAKGNVPAARKAAATTERPGAGSGAGSGAAGTKEMSKEEAGDAAWEAVFGKGKK